MRHDGGMSTGPSSSTAERRGIVVIEHEPDCPLDRMAEWLGDIAVDVIRPYAGDAVPAAVEGGLIVLGGQMSAYDDVVAPWLPAVRDLLAMAVSASVPTLGICLGAQLLAVAGGGRVDVAASAGRESGVVDARWRAEALTDPLMAGLPDPYPGPSMHADAVTALSSGATWLAASEMYPYQAFRVGAAAWGVQFHPEVSLATFHGWADLHPDVDTEAVIADYLRRDDDITHAGRTLTERFVTLCRSPVARW